MLRVDVFARAALNEPDLPVITEIRAVAESVRGYGGGQAATITFDLHQTAGQLEDELRGWAMVSATGGVGVCGVSVSPSCAMSRLSWCRIR